MLGLQQVGIPTAWFAVLGAADLLLVLAIVIRRRRRTEPDRTDVIANQRGERE
jgi:LPXTG-motif cell wall-anchored protein